MSYKQTYNPNLNAHGRAGWCLEYVDNAINAPNRTPSAIEAYSVEKRAGRIQTGALPVGVWVVIYFTFGQYGHVALAKNHGNRVEIHDSESRSGKRGVYSSIKEAENWLVRERGKYLGWSTHCDGRQIAQKVATASTSSANTSKSGTVTVTAEKLNVRNAPSLKSPVVAVYIRGEKFNFDSVRNAEGYEWLSYISSSGVRRYVARGKIGGEQYVR